MFIEYEYDLSPTIFRPRLIRSNNFRFVENAVSWLSSLTAPGRSVPEISPNGIPIEKPIISQLLNPKTVFLLPSISGNSMKTPGAHGKPSCGSHLKQDSVPFPFLFAARLSTSDLVTAETVDINQDRNNKTFQHCYKETFIASVPDEQNADL